MAEQAKPVAVRNERCLAVDPLRHPGWDSLLATHPRSCFFHGADWAQVLHATYGHRPIYFCNFVDDQLGEILPVMEVNSSWTGRRGVSLPFTDFSPPLEPGGVAQRKLFQMALEHGRKNRWRYLEVRNGGFAPRGTEPSLSFYGHALELGPGTEALFRNLDSSVRRGIRKAEQSGLRVEFGNTPEAMQTYYALHRLTRRRHGLPPQPYRFFENIAQYVLQKGHGFVAIARLEKRAVAAAVFFHENLEGIYKFGASDFHFQQLRPNNLVMWEAIKRYTSIGFSRLHLGRTSLSNEGLRRFKLGFGTREDIVEYHKFDFGLGSFVPDVDRAETWVNHVFRRMPQPLLRLAGELLYPHLA